MLPVRAKTLAGEKMTFGAGFKIVDFRSNSGPEMAGKLQFVRQKTGRLAQFEAPELSFPKMTFPDHVWNFQNMTLHEACFVCEFELDVGGNYFQSLVQVCQNLSKMEMLGHHRNRLGRR